MKWYNRLIIDHKGMSVHQGINTESGSSPLQLVVITRAPIACFYDVMKVSTLNYQVI